MASWYDRHITPRLIDCACGLKPIRLQREKIVPKAKGRILEVGIGSGLNMRHYDHHKVEHICGLDPALEFDKRANQRIADAGLQVELVSLSAETIPQPDDSFDTVLLTYTLCSIPDPVQALSEMRRVLRPEGKLLFCEHGQAPDSKVKRWQDRITPVWRKMAGNCHLGRDIPTLLDEGGFLITEMQQMYIPGPKPWCYNYWGDAQTKP